MKSANISKIAEKLYYDLCKVIDQQAKATSVMPGDAVDASIVFLATILIRAKDPVADYGVFKESILKRIRVALDETESLVSAGHN